MSYIAQLQEQRQRPSGIGALAIGLGQMAGGLGQAQMDAQDRQQKLEDHLREIAQGKASALQKVGQAYADSNNFAAAGKLLPDFAQSFNQAYGTDLPTAPIVGSPVMARGMDKVEQQGPPQVPGGKLLVDVPTPYMYDTGKREFDEGSQAAIRGGFLLPKVKPEYDQIDPYKITYDKTTGKIIRQADENPYKMTAEDQMKLRHEGYTAAMDRAKVMGGYGLERTRMTTTTSAANNAASNTTRTNIAGINNTNDLDVAGLNIGGRLAVAGVNNAAKKDAALLKAEAARKAAEAKKTQKQDVETSKASFMMARTIGQGVPGVGVEGIGAGGVISLNLPRGANGGEDQTAAQAVAATARSHGYKFTPGTNGQPAVLKPLPGAHAAGLRDRLVWRGNGDGTKTLVEGAPGVVSAAPPPKPGKDPATERAERRQRIWKESRDLARQEVNATTKMGRTPTEADIDKAHQRIFNQMLQAGEDPATKPDAAAELVEMMRADKAKKKGGR